MPACLEDEVDWKGVRIDYVKTLTAFFRAWLMRQTRRQVPVEVPAEITNKALNVHLKQVGGKIA